jgi:hypothetical protein
MPGENWWRAERLKRPRDDDKPWAPQSGWTRARTARSGEGAARLASVDFLRLFLRPAEERPGPVTATMWVPIGAKALAAALTVISASIVAEALRSGLPSSSACRPPPGPPRVIDVDWRSMRRGLVRLARNAALGETLEVALCRPADKKPFGQHCRCLRWSVMAPSLLLARGSHPSAGMPAIVRAAPDVRHRFFRGRCAARGPHGLFLA